MLSIRVCRGVSTYVAEVSTYSRHSRVYSFLESTLTLLQFKKGESWMLGLNELATLVSLPLPLLAPLCWQLESSLLESLLAMLISLLFRKGKS